MSYRVGVYRFTSKIHKYACALPRDPYVLRMKQAVHVATRYAPAPLLPRGRPSVSRAAEQTQRSSSFLCPIRSHGHRCTCLTR